MNKSSNFFQKSVNRNLIEFNITLTSSFFFKEICNTFDLNYLNKKILQNFAENSQS